MPAGRTGQTQKIGLAGPQNPDPREVGNIPARPEFARPPRKSGGRENPGPAPVCPTPATTPMSQRIPDLREIAEGRNLSLGRVPGRS